MRGLRLKRLEHIGSRAGGVVALGSKARATSSLKRHARRRTLDFGSLSFKPMDWGSHRKYRTRGRQWKPTGKGRRTGIWAKYLYSGQTGDCCACGVAT